jgi:hypothetical protein
LTIFQVTYVLEHATLGSKAKHLYEKLTNNYYWETNDHNHVRKKHGEEIKKRRQ